MLIGQKTWPQEGRAILQHMAKVKTQNTNSYQTKVTLNGLKTKLPWVGEALVETLKIFFSQTILPIFK